MSLAYFVKQLDNDEHLQAVIYRSAWMYLPSLAFGVILVWLPLFLFFYLESRYGSNGILVAVLAIILGLFVLAQRTMILKYTAWVVTNKRLLDFLQKGFLRAEVNEEYLEDLYRPSSVITKLWERLCGCSSIRIMLMHEKAFLEISGIGKPRRVIEFLKTIIPDYTDEKEKLKTLQDDLGEDEFETLLDEMSQEKNNK